MAVNIAQKTVENIRKVVPPFIAQITLQTKMADLKMCLQELSLSF